MFYFSSTRTLKPPKRFFTIITYLPDLLVFVKVESILFFMKDYYLPTYTLIQNGDVSPLMIWVSHIFVLSSELLAYVIKKTIWIDNVPPGRFQFLRKKNHDNIDAGGWVCWMIRNQQPVSWPISYRKCHDFLEGRKKVVPRLTL